MFYHYLVKICQTHFASNLVPYYRCLSIDPTGRCSFSIFFCFLLLFLVFSSREVKVFQYITGRFLERSIKKQQTSRNVELQRCVNEILIQLYQLAFIYNLNCMLDLVAFILRSIKKSYKLKEQSVIMECIVYEKLRIMKHG